MSSECRIRRERLTVQHMIELRCRLVHAPNNASLCPQCLELAQYVDQRLERCPLKADKPTCLVCPIHCYAPEKREEIRAVMRFSGPRMLLRHPILTFFHFWDGRRRGKPKSPGVSVPRP